MSTLLKSIKDIFSLHKGKSIVVPVKSNQAKSINAFQLFLQQMAGRINEHVEYEEDLSKNLPRDNTLIIKYNVDNYIKEIDEYFITKEIYSGNQDLIFKYLLEILVPPKVIRDQLSKENRRKLFSGTLVGYSYYSGQTVQGITKTFYNMITKQDDFNDVGKNDILEIFKESVEYIERSGTPDKIVKEHPQEVDTTELLHRMIQVYSVKNKRDLEALLFRHRFMNTLFTVGVLIIILMVLLLYSNEILAFLFNQSDNTIQKNVLYSSLSVGLIVFFIMLKIGLYAKYRVMRKDFLKSINLIIAEMKVNYEEVKKLFSDKYDFDIKRLWSIRKILKAKK